jgi:hypothetical protein
MKSTAEPRDLKKVGYLRSRLTELGVPREFQDEIVQRRENIFTWLPGNTVLGIAMIAAALTAGGVTLLGLQVFSQWAAQHAATETAAWAGSGTGSPGSLFLAIAAVLAIVTVASWLMSDVRPFPAPNIFASVLRSETIRSDRTDPGMKRRVSKAAAGARSADDFLKRYADLAWKPWRLASLIALGIGIPAAALELPAYWTAGPEGVALHSRHRTTSYDWASISRVYASCDTFKTIPNLSIRLTHPSGNIDLSSAMAADNPERSLDLLRNVVDALVGMGDEGPTQHAMNQAQGSMDSTCIDYWFADRANEARVQLDRLLRKAGDSHRP